MKPIRKKLPLLLAGAVCLVTALGLTPAAQAATQPFMVTSSLNSTTPFMITLPSTDAKGKPVKTVEIDFVTADCDAAPSVPSIGAALITVFFGGANGFYALQFGQPQSFVNQTEFVLTQKTLMYADPGSTLNFGLTGGQPTCTVTFSGQLILP